MTGHVGLAGVRDGALLRVVSGERTRLETFAALLAPLFASRQVAWRTVFERSGPAELDDLMMCGPREVHVVFRLDEGRDQALMCILPRDRNIGLMWQAARGIRDEVVRAPA